MPLLVSASPNHTTTIDLQANAFLRFCLGTVKIDETPGLALVAKYPPQGDIIALQAVPVSVAQSAEEVHRVAAVGLAGGTLDEDSKRLREAYEMFKNNPRVPSQAALEEAVEQGLSIVKAYWQLRDWLLTGCREELSIQEGSRTLRGWP